MSRYNAAQWYTCWGRKQIYSECVFTLKRQNCKRLTVLNAIKKGRSHRLLNALTLVALVQCERTLTKNPNNLGSSAISTRFYSLYCVYYLTRYFNRVLMLVLFCSQRIGFYTGMFNDKFRGICCSFDEKCIQEILSQMVKLCMLWVLLFVVEKNAKLNRIQKLLKKYVADMKWPYCLEVLVLNFLTKQ